MQDNSDILTRIATALTGLVKQIKAIRYYPPRHPALNAAAEECLRGFQPLFSGGRPLELSVRKEGFRFHDQPIAKGHQILGQLAMFCFARRIQTLTILADLSAKDLNHFVHYLILDHQKIQAYGGIQSLLEKARVTTIWVNEKDLDSILERRAALEQLPEEADIDPITLLEEASAAVDQQPEQETIDLFQLIERLEREQDDDKFRLGLQELVPQLRLNLDKKNRQLLLRGLVLLCKNASPAQGAARRREYATEALDQAASGEVVGFLIDALVDEQSPKSEKQTTSRVLAFLREKTARPLMARLAEEQQANGRKLLTETLAKCGSTALPVLVEYLKDERWYVARNTIAIIGEIRNQAATVHLRPLLAHDDPRVQREAVRALTRIGGQQAIHILIAAAQSSDPDLCRQALLSLGALRATAAVPILQKLLRTSGWSQRVMDTKKDAIRALGEIRSSEALPQLLAIATKKRLLRQRLNEELRIAALHAIGEIGDAQAGTVLERITDDKSAAVARAAALALNQINKAST
ncbi:MAG: HEAT repeat domain-containing protein [Desulfuromonadales bacterium]|nr:HEAT repeat domain-containing protein [Desulfuromonadales bacterium]